MLAYDKSFYDYFNDRKRVLSDCSDRLEFIENVSRPTGLKDVRQLTGINIRDEDYPYLGHSVEIENLSQLYYDLLNESKLIKSSLIGRTDLTQDELYKHPFGAEQFGATQAEIDAAQRVKVKVMMDTRFNFHHFTGVYAPPGELITIEIPEAVINKSYVHYNMHTRDVADLSFAGSFQRLPSTVFGSKANTLLTRTVNKMGYPIGGLVFLNLDPDILPEPFEVIISGGILAPWYRYGSDTEEEWEEIKKYPAPLACIETGNLNLVFRSYYIRTASRINDCVRFFRSAHQLYQSICPKVSNYESTQGDRENGRERVPNYWHFDTYVAVGAAFAGPGENYIQCPNGWVDDALHIEKVMRSGSWGLLHEMGHHHQKRYGKYWGIGYKGEVTNNVLNSFCYILYTELSSARFETTDQYAIFNSWERVSHSYMFIDNTDMFDEETHTNLFMYVQLMHSFGIKKTLEFIKADVEQSLYPKDEKGNNETESFLLRAASIFGYDIRDHVAYHRFNLSNLNSSVVEALDNMNLKPFYPITNLYSTGFIMNGELFETSRPFEISYGKKHIFNFTKYTKSRPGHGVFEIGDLEGTQGRWSKIENGVYEYTPFEDFHIIDNYTITYKETTSDQTIICFGRIKQVLNGNIQKRYTNIDSVDNDHTIFDVYNSTSYLEPDAEEFGTAMKIPSSQGKHMTVCRGKFVPPETNQYVFYAAPDEQALLYLSENPLTGDTDLDSDFLILEDTQGYHTTYNWQRASKVCNLEWGKIYYFVFVLYNAAGSGSGKVGCRMGPQGSISDVPARYVFPENISNDDINSIEKWIPEWDEIFSLDDFSRLLLETPDIISITGPAPQDETRVLENLINGNKERDEEGFVSKWDPKEDAAPFPHIYNLTFAAPTNFTYLELVPFSNVAYTITAKQMNITCDDELIHSGQYDSRTEGAGRFTFDEPIECSNIKISFSDNSYWWSSYRWIKGGTAFREFLIGNPFNAGNVVPVSHPYFNFKNGWTDVKYGSYYNGLGKRGEANAELEINLSKDVSEFVIIGDKISTASNSKSLKSQNDKASVYINNEKIGEFSCDTPKTNPYSEKFYKSILFRASDMESSTNKILKIVVDSGELTLAGILLKQDEIESGILYQDVTQNDSDNNDGSNNAAAISIAVVVVVVVIAIVVVVVVIVIRKKKMNSRRSSSGGTLNTTIY